MLRVCVDARSLPAASVTGTGVYLAELLRHLPTSVEASVLVASPAARQAARDAGLRTAASASGFDVFHRPSQVYQPAALTEFLRAPAPLVITYHDLISYRTPALFDTPALHREYAVLSFASLHAAQAVIAVSEHARREIVREFQLPEERVHAIHHGVDEPLFGARDARGNQALLEARGIDGPYLFCSGSDYPHKNLLPLLRGYAWLRATWKGPGATPALILSGPSSGAPGGIYRLGEAPASGVRYLGAVPRRELIALYQEALAFVYPSGYEGFGLPILEAMAAGTPVLCTRLTAVPEVAGDAAVYLQRLSPEEIAAAMRALATDAALRQRLIEAGRKRARQFRWAEAARRTADVYQQVAATRAPDVEVRRRMLDALTAFDWR